MNHSATRRECVIPFCARQQFLFQPDSLAPAGYEMSDEPLALTFSQVIDKQGRAKLVIRAQSRPPPRPGT
jgi:hypothetical protein